jgi:hypothetical protein
MESNHPSLSLIRRNSDFFSTLGSHPIREINKTIHFSEIGESPNAFDASLPFRRALSATKKRNDPSHIFFRPTAERKERKGSRRLTLNPT